MNSAGLRLRQRLADNTRRTLKQHFLEQREITLSLMEQLPSLADDIAVVYPLERFNGLLTQTLFTGLRPVYLQFGERAATDMVFAWNPSRGDQYVYITAFYTADNINRGTRGDVLSALTRPDPYEAVRAAFDQLLGQRAEQWAQTLTTSLANAGMHDAAWQADMRSKVWESNSDDPRHADLDGETVAMGDLFSNGLRWPADVRGDAEETTNCQCTIRFEGGG